MGKPKRIIFNLKRLWTYPDGRTVDLYEEIKSGRKISEWRDYKPYWEDRLFKRKMIDGMEHFRQKVNKAWFVVGFPKNNLPRLEADITNILIHVDDEGFAEQIEIKFTNVKEVTE